MPKVLRKNIKIFQSNKSLSRDAKTDLLGMKEELL